MKKNTVFLFLSSIVLLLMSAYTPADSQSKSSSRSNLLIIINDQWRGEAVGYTHNGPVRTPHLDSLARHSLVLTNMISNSPVCSPARAMLMTGEYPLTNHVYGNVTSRTRPYHIQLAKDAVCWSDVLKQSGYSLGYIGKWHLTSPHLPYIPTANNKGKVKWNEWTPPDERHGFDFWYAYGAYGDHDKPMYWSTNAGRTDFHYVNEWEEKHNVDVAIQFLKNKEGKDRDPSKPFALVVSTNIPHSPYQLVPEKYYDLYKNMPIDSFVKDPDIPAAGTKMGDHYRKSIRYYYAGVTGMDDQIGRLLKALHRTGLDKNTIILITADHGDCIGKHNELSKNNMYEEAMRIPFILYWNGHICPRMDSCFLMSYPDIYPTLLGLMGVGNKIPASVQGKNWASYVMDGKGRYPTTQYFMANIHPPDTASGYRGIRTDRYKLAYYRKSGSDTLEGYFFDRKNDPFEMHNEYNNSQYLQVKDSLNNVLTRWLNKTNDPYKIKEHKLNQLFKNRQ